VAQVRRGLFQEAEHVVAGLRERAVVMVLQRDEHTLRVAVVGDLLERGAAALPGDLPRLAGVGRTREDAHLGRAEQECPIDPAFGHGDFVRQLIRRLPEVVGDAQAGYGQPVANAALLQVNDRRLTGSGAFTDGAGIEVDAVGRSGPGRRPRTTIHPSCRPGKLA